VLAACVDLGGVAGGGGSDAGPDGSVPPGTDGGVPPGTDGGAPAHTYIAVMGGQTTGGGNIADVYLGEVAEDGSIAAWRSEPSLGVARFRGGSALVGDTLVYFCGGDSSGIGKTAFLSTVSGGTIGAWAEADQTATFANGVFRMGAFAYAGELFVVGGLVSGGTHLPDVWHAPVNGTTLGGFAKTASMPEGRAGVALAVSGEHVYVMGGEVDPSSENVASGLVGDLAPGPTIATWRALPDLPYATSSGAGAATSTHVYQSGGYSSGKSNAVSIAPIQPDGSLGAWVNGRALSSNRNAHQMVVARGRMYVIAGIVPDTNEPIATVEFADIGGDGSLGDWKTTTPLPKPVGFHTAVVIER
jgi:hypothetical protein